MVSSTISRFEILNRLVLQSLKGMAILRVLVYTVETTFTLGKFSGVEDQNPTLNVQNKCTIYCTRLIFQFGELICFPGRLVSVILKLKLLISNQFVRESIQV